MVRGGFAGSSQLASSGTQARLPGSRPGRGARAGALRGLQHSRLRSSPSEARRLAEPELLTLLRDAVAATSEDLDAVLRRLADIHRRSDPELAREPEQVIALGFLAVIKALREGALMSEIAVREGTEEIRQLGDRLLEQIAETRQVVAANRQALIESRRVLRELRERPEVEGREPPPEASPAG